MSVSARSAHLLNASENEDSTTQLGSLLQCLTTVSEEILNFQSKPPVVQLETITLLPITFHLRKENDILCSLLDICGQQLRSPSGIQTEQPPPILLIIFVFKAILLLFSTYF